MLKNKKIMVLLGSVLIVLVLAIFLWPHFKQGYAGTTVEVVRMASDIEHGTVITSEMVRVKEFPAAYLEDMQILSKDEVVGQYAATDLFKGDIVSANNIVSSDKKVFYEQNNLVAVTLPTLSASVAAKIKPGDRVNIYGYPKDNANAGIVWRPEILQHMEIAYVVSSDAQDAGDGIAPASVVLKVSSAEQTQELVKLEYTAQIHLERVSNNAGQNAAIEPEVQTSPEVQAPSPAAEQQPDEAA